MNKLIAVEYARFKCIDEILNIDRSEKYYLAVCESLYCMAMFGKVYYKNSNDHVLFDVSLSHEFYSPLLALIGNQFSYNDVIKIISLIQQKIKTFLDIRLLNKTSVVYGITKEEYFCGNETFKFNKEIHNKLLNKLKEHDTNITPQECVDKIILCWMRYKCIPYIHGHYSLVNSDNNKFFNKIQLSEVFTNPFLFSVTQNKYYSLFNDTDGCFGSSGNFFVGNNGDNSTLFFIVPPICIITSNVLKFIAKNKITNFILIVQPNNTVLHNCLIKRLIYENSGVHYVRNKNYNKHVTLENKFNTTIPLKYTISNPHQVFISGKLKAQIFTNIKYLNDNETQYTRNKLTYQLEKEYYRYIFVNELAELLNGHEWLNILERFLISMANLPNEKKNDEILIDLPINHPIYKKMSFELIEKKIFLGNTVVLVKDKISAYLKTVGKPKKQLFYGRHDNTFYYGKFKKTIDERRKISLFNIKQENFVEHVLIIMLRYESLLPRGQNWNLPYKWYYNVNKLFNISLEGFSNPLNSQMMIVKPNSSFCSLFESTDKYFGSLGNLFSLDILKFYEKEKEKSKDNVVTISLNPPYVLSLMVNSIKLIKEWMNHNIKLRIFIGFPYWENVPEFRNFEKFKFVKKHKVLCTCEYYYENSMDCSIPKIFHDKYQLFYLENFQGKINNDVFEEMKPFFNTK